MDRRGFLTTGGRAAVAAASGAAIGTAALPVAAGAAAIVTARREIALADCWPGTCQGLADSAHRLARHVERLSEGRIKINHVPAGARADAVHRLAYAGTDRGVAFAYFGGLVGGRALAPNDFEAWLTIAGGQAQWDELAREHSIKPVLAGHLGPGTVLWGRRQVADLSDFAGMRIATFGLGASVARALGAIPKEVAPADLAKALDEGRIDAAEWGGVLHGLALGLTRAAPVITGPAFHGHGMTVALEVDLALWESLPEGDRRAIVEAGAAEYRLSVAEARANEASLRQAMGAATGNRFDRLPATVAHAVARVADATVAHIAGSDARAARIDRSYMAFKASLEDGSPAAIS